MITHVITEKQANKADYCYRDQNILVGELKSGLLSLKNSLDRNPKKKRDLDKTFEENALNCIQILKNISVFSDKYATQIGE